MLPYPPLSPYDSSIMDTGTKIDNITTITHPCHLLINYNYIFLNIPVFGPYSLHMIRVCNRCKDSTTKMVLRSTTEATVPEKMVLKLLFPLPGGREGEGEKESDEISDEQIWRLLI